MKWIFSMRDEFSVELEKISNIWDETGVLGWQLDERRSTCKKHLFNLLEEMLSEESNRKQAIVSKVSETAKMINEMRMEVEQEEGDFQLQDSWKPLMKLEKLEAEKKRLDQKSECILKQWNQLLGQKQALVERLCITSIETDQIEKGFKHVPSNAILNQLKSKVQDLLALKRQKEIDSLAVAINQMRERLQLDPINAPTTLDEESLKVLRMENETQMAKVTDLEKNCESKMARLELLSSRLDMTTPFLKPDQWTTRNGQELGAELQKLEALRCAKLPQLIAACREELQTLVSRCHLRAVESIAGARGNNEEEILASLEQAIDKWQRFYTQHQQIFKAFDRLSDAMIKLTETEKQLRDPQILKNRGGILLKVEKELKMLKQREIPRAEKEFLASADSASREFHHLVCFPGNRTLDEVVSEINEKENTSGIPSTPQTSKKRTQQQSLLDSSATKRVRDRHHLESFHF
ncbi:carboxypeptidase C prc1 [Cichlidogyrus casuarinus]|uniref:Carboxypeptidase C prc1 n=1 Tax=Cichlidogyrus casuarinus TaxID=1844966 RepID=A0ABD2PTX5_9PLAT